VVLAQGPIITVADLSLETPPDKGPAVTGDRMVLPANASLAQIERETIIQALQRSEGNRQVAARQLGIGVSTLYRKLKEYQLV
jgi:DNA-binding NtrC family response regulator